MPRADSLRKDVYDLWVGNPYTTAKSACQKLEKDYKIHGNYINKLLSEFRSYYQFGSPQKPHLLPEHRVFEWERVPRFYDHGEGMPLAVYRVGWRVSKGNRNDMWVFRDPEGQGSVHWYKEGLIRLYLKGELQLARAKELFCRAFSWFGKEDIRRYLDVPLVEKYRKWTFELGQPMPRFDIRQFERSHGLRIFTDLSHPTSVHVGESIPFWIDEQRQATSELSKVVNEFGVDIKEHLKLITGAQDFVKEIYQEAKEWRQDREVSRLREIKRLEKHERPGQKSILDFMFK